jgi:hypothetical protein
MERRRVEGSCVVVVTELYNGSDEEVEHQNLVDISAKPEGSAPYS